MLKMCSMISEPCERKSIQSDDSSNKASSLTYNSSVIKDQHRSRATRASVLLLLLVIELVISIPFCWS